MKKLFADLPEAIINIQEIIDKVEFIRYTAMCYFKYMISLRNL
jgi:hypothetical protein